MKHNTFLQEEAGRQAAQFDWNTYGKEMPEKYPDWDELQPFEMAYMEYIREQFK